MNKLLNLILTCLVCFSTAKAQWQPVGGPNGSFADCIEWLDNTWWIGTSNGIFRQNGAVWEHLFLTELNGYRITDIYAAQNGSTAHVLGANLSSGGTKVFTLENGGAGWSVVKQFNVPVSCCDYLGTIHESNGTISVLMGSAQQLFRFDADGNQTGGTEPATAAAFDGDATLLLRPDGAVNYQSSPGGNWQILYSAVFNEPVMGLFLRGSVFYVFTKFRIFRSANQGQQWSMVFTNSGVNDGIKAIDAGGGLLYAVSDHYFFKSADNGLHWNNQGGTPTVYSKDIGHHNGAVSISGFYGVHRSDDEGLSWVLQNEGLNATDVRLLRHTAAGLVIPQARSRSIDGGAHWSVMPSFPQPTYPADFEAAGNTFFLTTSSGLYISTNAGGNWTLVASPASGFTPRSVKADGNLVYAIANERVDVYDADGVLQNTILPPVPGILDYLPGVDSSFISVNGKKLYVSGDNDANWAFRNNIPNSNLLRSGNNLICWSGSTGMSYSGDNGFTWAASETPYNNWPIVYDLIALPGDVLAAASAYQGVMVSFDNGATLEYYNEGLNGQTVNTITRDQDALYIGADGAGVWRRDIDFSNYKGFVFWDANNNGQQDAGELPAGQVLVGSAEQQVFATTGATGAYTLFSTGAADTVRVVSPLPGYAPVPPFYAGAQLAATGNNFALQGDYSKYDLDIKVVPLTPFRPGFPTYLWVLAKNASPATAQNVQLKMVIGTDLASIQQTGIMPDLVVGDTLYWSLGAIGPFQTAQFTIEMFVDAATPPSGAVPVRAEISPLNNDVAANNNTFVRDFQIVGSYDPNDKQVTPAFATPDQLTAGEAFTYTVRFQNTGNHPADFVRILDTLSKQLDVASFRFDGSSHPCTWKVHGEGVLEIFFRDIYLPDSTSDEAGSHGYAQFSVRPKAGLPIGDAVNNRAHIFFDYNAPITTNTAQTKVVFALPDAGQESASVLSARPNPAITYLKCTWDNTPAPGPGVLRLLNVYGLPELEADVYAGDTEKVLDVSFVPNGVYFVMLDAGGLVLWRKVTVFRDRDVRKFPKY